MSLDDDLAALEATDPTVRSAAQRLGETAAEIRSTSARLRAVQRDYAKTQAALAASQADLTRATDDRDAWHRVAKRVTNQRDLARAELASARQELDRLRSYRVDVARNNRVGDCGFCGVQIMRGQAVEQMPAVEPGAQAQLRHTFCPDRCERCEQLIQPGEDHEELPGTGGHVWHTYPCTDKETGSDG